MDYVVTAAGNMPFEMASIRWKLDKILDENGITPYALAKEGKGLSMKVVYQIVNNETNGVRWPTLVAVMQSVKTMTGKDYTFDDLLEFKKD